MTKVGRSDRRGCSGSCSASSLIEKLVGGCAYCDNNGGSAPDDSKSRDDLVDEVDYMETEAEEHGTDHRLGKHVSHDTISI